MGWRLSLAKKDFNIAKGFLKKGATRLNEVGEKAKPVVKSGAKKAAKQGIGVLDTVTRWGSNVNRNIEKQYSGGPTFDLGFGSNKKTGKRKRKKGRKGKRRRITVVID